MFLDLPSLFWVLFFTVSGQDDEILRCRPLPRPPPSQYAAFVVQSNFYDGIIGKKELDFRFSPCFTRNKIIGGFA